MTTPARNETAQHDASATGVNDSAQSRTRDATPTREKPHLQLARLIRLAPREPADALQTDVHALVENQNLKGSGL